MEIVTENATSLAWIGDAYMSLQVRLYLLDKGYRKADLLQKMNAKMCSAKAQSYILKQLEIEDFFDDDEKQILARGRNATIHSKAKNASYMEYLKATALEALIGYLYLYQHQDRLDELMDKIIMIGAKL